VIARRTFFDFGPPFNYYELLLVNPTDNGTSIERILLTPAADACYLPAKIDIKSVTTAESVQQLLGSKNPCDIPEKDLHRELKRKKKGLVFSGADIAIQVQCGTSTRIIRADILDRDMFDPAPNTPPQTSWTMQLLERLDKALGPGVMDKPIFPVAEEEPPAAKEKEADLPALRDVSAGRYDALFAGARDKPSDLYRAAQIRPPTPTVRVVNTLPVKPEESAPPKYPPLAKAARIEGPVAFKVDVESDGRASNFTLVSGHPMLVPAVKDAVGRWRFPKEAAGQQVDGVIEFATNCPKSN
jgi:TonB family protein